MYYFFIITNNNIGDYMRIYKIFIIGSIMLILFWIYILYISPRIHNTKEIEIPEISGDNIDTGINKLNELDIKHNIYYLEGDDNTIAYTIPKAGMSIYKSYTIDVYAYKAVNSYYKSYIGLIYENYINELNELSLKHNIAYRVEYILDNSYKNGVIINQNKLESDIINPNDELILYVATTDDYYTVPLFVGMNIYDAINELKSNDILCNIIYYSSPIEADIVIYQSIEEGYKIKKGNSYSFDLYVSKGFN